MWYAMHCRFTPVAPPALPRSQVCVGFGVSRPDQAAQIKSWGAEGVICGSALVKALGESSSPVREGRGQGYA